MMPDAYPYAVRAVCTFIKKELASQLRDDLLAVVTNVITGSQQRRPNDLNYKLQKQ